MIDLCIDTSTVTSIGVVRDGVTLAKARSQSTRHHVETIVPMMRELLTEAGLPTGGRELAEAGLRSVCVGTGPAPFTGLRAGLMSARIFADVAGVPVYGVSSLDVLARAALDVLPPETRLLVLSDARRKELYWGVYTSAGADDVELHGRLEVGDPQLAAAELRVDGTLIVCEEHLPTHAQALLGDAPLGPLGVLDPTVMVRITQARVNRAETARLSTQPQYLRRPDIHGQAPERM